MKHLLALMVAGLALAASANCAETASLDAEIREAARAWLANNEGIGLTIGIYDNGQRSFYNFGTTQLDGNKPPTKDTVYEIGGISKTMTGQLLARAVVEGRASLDDEAAKYLDGQYPNLANAGESVRLLHLANDTSQLMDNIPELTQVRAIPGEPLAVTHMRVIEKYTQEEFLRQLHRVMPRLPPGKNVAFSNVGSILLGVVLEKIYGEPFEKILAREIEKPMRMNSGVAPPEKLLAQGHTTNNEPLPAYTAKMLYPANTLRYSAQDLLTFASWQLMERDASVKLAHQPAWSAPDGRVSVGFFWIIGNSQQGRRLLSTGDTFGFSSTCDLYPEAKLAVVVLANKNADGAQESLRALSARIVRLLRPTVGQGLSQPSSAVAPPPGR